MAKIEPAFYIKGISGKMSKSDDQSFVHNKTTNKVHTRHNRGKRTVPTTDAQEKNQKSFSVLAHEASVWMKANNAKACPPYGSVEYQRMMEMFHNQNEQGYPLQFVMRLMKNGKFDELMKA